MPRTRRLTLVLAAASLAVGVTHPPAAGAAVCASADAVRAQASRGDVARAAVCVINAERRGHGLGILRIDGRLSLAARRHSTDMVKRRYFAHTAPSGLGFADRIRRAGYLSTANHWFVGETLGWGWGGGASAERIVRAWMHSPEHRRILMRPAYREVGVGVVWGGPRHRAAPEATFSAEFGVIY